MYLIVFVCATTFPTVFLSLSLTPVALLDIMASGYTVSTFGTLMLFLGPKVWFVIHGLDVRGAEEGQMKSEAYPGAGGAVTGRASQSQNKESVAKIVWRKIVSESKRSSSSRGQSRGQGGDVSNAGVAKESRPTSEAGIRRQQKTIGGRHGGGSRVSSSGPDHPLTVSKATVTHADPRLSIISEVVPQVDRHSVLNIDAQERHPSSYSLHHRHSNSSPGLHSPEAESQSYSHPQDSLATGAKSRQGSLVCQWDDQQLVSDSIHFRTKRALMESSDMSLAEAVIHRG